MGVAAAMPMKQTRNGGKVDEAAGVDRCGTCVTAGADVYVMAGLRT
jgi:hypothetical protein